MRPDARTGSLNAAATRAAWNTLNAEGFSPDGNPLRRA